MIGEIGHFCLIVALMLALAQGILPLAGAARGVSGWMAVAQPAAQGQFLFVAISFVSMPTELTGPPPIVLPDAWVGS